MIYSRYYRNGGRYGELYEAGDQGLFSEAAEPAAPEQDQRAGHCGGLRHQPQFLLLPLSRHPLPAGRDRHRADGAAHSGLPLHLVPGRVLPHGVSVRPGEQTGGDAHLPLGEPGCVHSEHAAAVRLRGVRLYRHRLPRQPDQRERPTDRDPLHEMPALRHVHRLDRPGHDRRRLRRPAPDAGAEPRRAGADHPPQPGRAGEFRQTPPSAQKAGNQGPLSKSWTAGLFLSIFPFPGKCYTPLC